MFWYPVGAADYLDAKHHLDKKLLYFTERMFRWPTRLLQSWQVIAWCGCSYLSKQIPPRKPLRAELLWTLRRRQKTTVPNVR
jgi:hypothetical protein